MKTGWHSEQGGALIAIVWTVLLLSILAVGVLHLSKDMRQLPHSAQVGLKRKQLAEAAAELYLQRHLKSVSGDTVFSNSIDVLGQSVSVDIILEDSKIDLNQSGHGLLSALFASLGQEPSDAISLADAVIDWRDQDNLVTGSGAEAFEYGSLSLPYRPRNGPLETVGELRFVRGVSQQLYECLLPVVTVYAEPGTGETIYKGVELGFSPTEVRSVFAWALAANWQDQYWPNVTAIAADPNDVVLQNKALTLRIRLPGQFDSVYSKVIRLQNVSPGNMEYSTLRKLRQEEVKEGNSCHN